jgi:cytidylate kinase
MSDNRAIYRQIAGRMYDLDAEVYRVLGSSLGRVFNGQREHCIEELVRAMELRPDNHYIRSELALIGNMARTIPIKEARARAMTEYNEIMKLLESMPSIFGEEDILDETAAKLNKINLSGRFADGSHLIICIGRTYGCAGTDIGFALADTLKINYYDAEIFTEVLERLEADKNALQDRASFAHHQNLNRNLKIQEHRSLKEWLREFNRYHGLPKEDAVFFNQSDLLYDMARQEDFIIMGRCADVILTNRQIPHVSIFINAPFEMRARRVMSTDELSYKEACKLLHKLDRQHRRYYEFYTGRKWGNSNNYDLCINSASYGIEGSVQLIERVINQHTRKKPENP